MLANSAWNATTLHGKIQSQHRGFDEFQILIQQKQNAIHKETLLQEEE
jgi:hypothetical protein